MANAKYNLPLPLNEPIKRYAPGAPERELLKAGLKELKSQQIEIPLIIGGKEVKTGKLGQCIIPHDHQIVIGTYHQAGENEVQMAIKARVKLFFRPKLILHAKRLTFYDLIHFIPCKFMRSSHLTLLLGYGTGWSTVH